MRKKKKTRRKRRRKRKTKTRMKRKKKAATINVQPWAISQMDDTSPLTWTVGTALHLPVMMATK